MSPPLRPAIYERVSRKEQAEGYSLDQQDRALRAYCAAQGWAEPRVYIEPGHSAHAEKAAQRPVWRQLMADAEAREFDVVLVHKLDRWARHGPTAQTSLAQLHKRDIGFVSLAENLNFTGPWGKAIFAILSTFAELYSDNLSNEVKKGLAGRKAAGLPHPPYPFASRLVDGRLELDPQLAPHLARVLELAATQSDRRAAYILNEEGIPPRWSDHWEGTTVRQVVKAAGWLVDQPPPWPARLAAALARPRTVPVRKGTSVRLLTGLIRCGVCGCRMTHGAIAARNYQASVVCWHRGNNKAGCLPGAPRKTNAPHYEAIVLAWVAALPAPALLVRASERLVARDDPALAELAEIRAARRRVEEKYDAGLIDRDTMYAQAALLNERERAVAPQAPDLLRHTYDLAAALPLLAAMPPAEANAILRACLDAVIITGRDCAVIPQQWFAEVIAEATRAEIAA